MITEEAGVVDDDVEVAKGIDGLFYHRSGVVPARDIAKGNDGLATQGLDLFDHLPGRFLIGPRAVTFGPQIVDHQACPLFGQRNGFNAAEPAPSAGHDRNFSIQVSHVALL